MFILFYIDGRSFLLFYVGCGLLLIALRAAMAHGIADCCLPG